MTMKLEALSIFSTFSSPSARTRNVLKDQNGKPVIPDVSDELKTSEAEQTVGGGCRVSRFTPYSAKIPWHTGSRGVLSRLFPRYGNYCGPNWSSGRESGSLFWDKAPIDALDFCCYEHDMGYDSYRQEDLHKADFVFLNCLNKIPQQGLKPGDSPLSEPYRNLYIFGLKTVLIPYRKFLLQKVDAKTRKRLTEEEIFGKDRRGPGQLQRLAMEDVKFSPHLKLLREISSKIGCLRLYN